MFASWRVGIVFTAANMTGRAFSTLVSQANNAERAVDGSAAALSRLRVIGMAAFATVGVLGVATFTKAADAAGKYQLQMSLLQQQLGATDGQMEAIGKRIISLSSGPTRTMFGMGELAVMARGIQQSGLGAGAVENLLTPIAYAAEIEKLRHGGHLDTAQFTANVSATIKGLGLGAPGREKDAMSFADLFTRYASISKLDSAGLLAYENQFGLISREAGWKGEDFLAAGAYLSQMGVKPQMIGTMMKNIVTNLNPRANLTGHAANAQFSGLAMLGMLKPSDPGMARKYLSLVESSQKNLGLEGVDPSKMTAKQQDTLGQAVLRASVTSKAWGGGLAGVVTLLSTAQDSFAKEFGADKANAMMITLARNVFNLRGLPPALAMAQGGMKSLNDLKAQALLQVPLDARAAALRGEYEPMKEMFGQMINSVMITLGGVTAGGKVTAGGPLDIATKVLQQIETFIGLMTAWSANNPKLIAQIGTMIGVLGVGGLVAAGVLATGAMLTLTGTLWGMARAGYAAAGGSVAGAVGGVAGLLRTLASRGATSSISALEMGGESAIGLMVVPSLMARMLGGLARFGLALGELGSGIGIMFAIGIAVHQFIMHLNDLSYLTGKFTGWIVYDLGPGIVKALQKILPSILGAVAPHISPSQMLYNMLHPPGGVNGLPDWKSVSQSFMGGLNSASHNNAPINVKLFSNHSDKQPAVNKAVAHAAAIKPLGLPSVTGTPGMFDPSTPGGKAFWSSFNPGGKLPKSQFTPGRPGPASWPIVQMPGMKVDVNVYGLTLPEVIKKIEQAVYDGVLNTARRSGGTANTQGLLVGGGGW